MQGLYDVHIHPDYRELTEAEQEAQMQAMRWLKKQRISTKQIALLTLRNIDLEGKRALFVTETRFVTVRRVIRYKGTPLDHYLTEVFPEMKVVPFVFPSSAWTKRKPTLGFHVKEERLSDYLRGKSCKNGLDIVIGYDKMELTKMRWHIN